MIKNIVNDASKFKLLPRDFTKTRQTSLQNYLNKLNKKGAFTKEEYKMIYPVGSGIARIYGLPKIHKLKDVVIMYSCKKIAPCWGIIRDNYKRKIINKEIPHIYNI